MKNYIGCNRKNLQVLWLFILILPFTANAQTWQWASGGGATDNLDAEYEEVYSMYTAPTGDSYISSNVGRINLEVKGVPKITYSAFGLTDIIITGFSCDGNYKWSKVIGSYYGAGGMHVGGDSAGNVYAACSVNPTTPNALPSIHFDADVVLPCSALNVNTYKQTLFLIKYDKDGNYQWYRTPQAVDVSRTVANGSRVLDLEVDAAGNTYWLCSLSPSSYGNGLYAVSQKGVHILKYDTDGNFLAGFPLDMTILAPPYDFKMKRDPISGNIYLGGEHPTSSNLSFGGQPVTHSKYIAAFNSTGNLLWERENGATTAYGEGGVSYDVAIDSDSSVYFIGTTGYLTSGDPTVPDSFNGTPFVNMGDTPPWPFIVKLDVLGNTIWQTNGRQSSLRSVAVNGNEVGVTSGARDLRWQNQTFLDPASGGRPFIARFNKANGQIIAINALHTDSDDRGTALTADAHGNYYLGGRFGSSLTAGTETITNRGGQSDFFVAKFGQSNCNLATTGFNSNTTKVYPNPVRDSFFVEGIQNQNYTIYDVLGQTVKSGKLIGQEGIDIQYLPSGVYFLKFSDNLQSVKAIKITKI